MPRVVSGCQRGHSCCRRRCNVSEVTCPFPVLALPVVERNRKRQDPILSRRTGAQVKESLLHMLPEVNPLPDVKDLRFNI